MINRIIDSFVLELLEVDNDIHQIDIFQDGKIRVTFNSIESFRDNYGDGYDDYFDHTISHIHYVWFQNINELVNIGIFRITKEKINLIKEHYNQVMNENIYT